MGRRCGMKRAMKRGVMTRPIASSAKRKSASHLPGGPENRPDSAGIPLENARILFPSDFSQVQIVFLRVLASEVRRVFCIATG